MLAIKKVICSNGAWCAFLGVLCLRKKGAEDRNSSSLHDKRCSLTPRERCWFSHLNSCIKALLSVVIFWSKVLGQLKVTDLDSNPVGLVQQVEQYYQKIFSLQRILLVWTKCLKKIAYTSFCILYSGKV